MAERTKLWIAAAMKRLMVKKPLDKIRVTEICREAEIERPTFYYHFQDKYDLVAWIFFQDADSTDVLSVESAAAGMNKMRQEMLFYRRAYEDSSQNALWKYMLEYFADRYTRDDVCLHAGEPAADLRAITGKAPGHPGSFHMLTQRSRTR